MKTNLELISFVKSKLGVNYVYAAKGETITQAKINQWAKLYPGTFTASYIAKATKLIGKTAVDCSGLISWCTGTLKGSAAYQSSATKKGSIKDIPEVVGLGVWRSGHIGIYIGNGKVIEAKGIDYGVVETDLSKGTWTHYLYLNDIEYVTFSAPIAPSSSQLSNKAIDVSSYQGDINWTKAKVSGIDKAVLKVIRKDLNPDNKFEQNYTSCKSVNIDVIGVYNYSYATTVAKAKSDAQKVLAILNGRKIKVWLDVEADCQKELGSLLKDIINTYQDVIESAGYEFGVYTGMSFYTSYLKSYASQIKCKDWWIARYYNGYNKMDISVLPNEQYNPKSTVGRNIWGWQYTSSGQVPGINGDVDVNMIYQVGSASTPATPTISETSITDYGKITASSLHIRATPDSSSAINKLGSYKENDLVKLIAKTSNGWYKTDKGYISANYVSLLTKMGLVYNCTALNMRKSPSSSLDNVVKTLEKGDEIRLSTEQSGWYYAITKAGTVGWVSSKYIKVT